MQRGVSASKEDVHAAIANLDKGIFPNAFCKIISDILGGDEKFCNVMHADGAGTKSSLAYMYWKETGDISVWRGIAQDAIVMNLDDLLCVGVTDNILLSSTIGRNKNLIPGEIIAAIIGGTEAFLEKMRQLGVGIFLTGGETADVGDIVRTIIVDSTVSARVKRSDIIENNIQPGDVNDDQIVDVLDVVIIINFVMGNTTPDQHQFEASDLNEDGIIDILDIVMLIAIIMGS